MLSYKANDYITLKLENNSTQIYVKDRKFTQCIRLVLNIPTAHFKDYEQINSIDEAADVYKRKTIHQNRIIHEDGARNTIVVNNITPEQEFWGHCSNIQTWVEHKYDTRLLHSNLSFPLLQKLYEEGDPVAKQVFKEEIAMRLESGAPNVIEYLWRQRVLDYLSLDDLTTVFVTPKFIENLIKNLEDCRTFGFIDWITRNLIGSPEDFHIISPHTIKVISDLIYALLSKGNESYLRKYILENSSIMSVIYFLEDIKEYTRVIDLCKIVLDKYPRLPRAWNALGYALISTGKYQEGIDACENALSCDKGVRNKKIVSAVAWNNIGWAYNYMGKYSDAIDACNNAIKLKADFPNPYNHLGFAYYKMGQDGKGLFLIEKAISLNPLYTRALSNLGRIHYELKDYEQSFNSCYKCLKIDPHFREGLLLLKDLITNRELIDISISDYTKYQENSKPFQKLLRWLRRKN
ncbi:MAG: tetratricopeptide repeat protein [Candidatus Thorarchaeota archaeon]